MFEDFFERFFAELLPFFCIQVQDFGKRSKGRFVMRFAEAIARAYILSGIAAK